MKPIIKKECFRHGLTDFTLRTGAEKTFRCKKCSKEAVVKRRKVLREKLIQAFGGSCQCCGYNECNGCLDFHHLDPAKKDFSLSEKGLTRSFEKLLNEAKKCILVCCRCHREIHFGFRKIPSAVA